MEFFINKNSTLPILKMELITNNSDSNSEKFFEYLQNANITFTMIDIENGITKIGKATATIFFKEDSCPNEEYYIGYVFKKRDTNTCGRYKGFFEITFLNGYGNLIVPIQEELFINILEGNMKK